MPGASRLHKFIWISLFTLPLLFTCKEQGTDAYREDPQGPVFLNDPAELEQKAAAIDSLVNFKFKRQGFNGVILVGHRGQILYEKAIGMASRKRNDSLETNALFELASVSKQFTAVAILQLVEAGKISLSDSIQRFFPDFPHRGISVHMLLSHRSGLSNYMYDADRIWPDHSEYIDNQSLLELLSTEPQQVFFPPNKRFDYSNTGYALLAAIVEKVSGLRFADYADTYLFGPAGMKTAFVINPEKRLPRGAVSGHTGYYRPVTTQYYLNSVSGDKGIYASARDLYAWEQALFNHVLLKPGSMELALQAHNPPNRKGHAYGYGWRLFPFHGKTIYYHGGWWRGFKTLLIHLPDDHSCIIALSNKTSGGNIDKEALLSILYGTTAKEQKAD
ncbi:MAG: serine hydrolase domain-containing protein [Bacteroidia bacterium]